MYIRSGLSFRFRKQSFTSSVYFFLENYSTGTCMHVQLCWAVLVQDLIAFVTEKLYCFALYIWLDWFTLYILAGLNKISGIHVLGGSVIWAWFCLSRVAPVISFGISRVYHLWSSTLVFQKRSREKDLSIGFGNEINYIICNKNRRKSV